MYQKYPNGGSINLWCDARCQEDEVIIPVKLYQQPIHFHKGSLSDVLMGAAVAFASVMTGGSKPQDQSSSTGGAADRVNVESSSGACVSPGKAVELRMKNIEQLWLLQQLLDHGIFSESEYTEQTRSYSFIELTRSYCGYSNLTNQIAQKEVDVIYQPVNAHAVCVYKVIKRVE